jgi:hypothetical protein
MSKIKRITPEAKLEIIKGIEFYARKGTSITWKLLANEFSFTRAAMSRNQDIKDAYKNAKEGIKASKTDTEKLEELLIENDKLTKQRDKFKSSLSEYESKYLNWVYNAQNHGLTPEKLNIPIPESAKTTMRKKGLK